eukprot:TRINITY_DN76009_c0_g1_i1.p1 TRINITY_DN76009_c0_g1~~TRINITY_DN76009_c0_g1_i1.p1  ORF type:complete len:616 (-),score=134.03 TRINITY_DN76009_c0_g1_i1:53-1768(-)
MGKGPPWRVATEKVMTEACQINKGQPSVFCFPNVQELVEGLLKASENGVDFNGETFLLDIHVVVNSMLSWPSAWAGLSQLLSPSKPWTKAYCDKILGDSPIWYAPPMVRRSFLTPKHTLAQVEKDTPHAAAAMHRWFDELSKNGDGTTKELLRSVKANDAADVKSKSVHGRPLMRLMMHEHAKALKHIWSKACKSSKSARAKLERQDQNGLTVLHHLASQGNAAGLEAILRSTQKAKRNGFASVRDKSNYTAEDWASLADFEDSVAVLRKLGGVLEPAPEGGAAPAEPLKLFPAAEGTEECRADDASPRCTSDTGGWRKPDPEVVPAEWLPPADKPCAEDVIDVSQFAWDVFANHYVLHPRPLLIKGAARPEAAVAGNWTRAGLLAAAKDRKVELQRFPTEKAFDGTRPLKMTLGEYLEVLDNRSSSSSAMKKKLHFGHIDLDEHEIFLNFSAVLPNILEGKVDHKATTFLLGGALMGTPPKHHGPAVDSLVHGSKLWFLDPPGREQVAHTTVHDYLVRSKGAPGFHRCIQDAGDLLYVPRGWTYANICLGDCIGASLGFTSDDFDLRDSA